MYDVRCIFVDDKICKHNVLLIINESPHRLPVTVSHSLKPQELLMRPALCYSICVMRSCVVASCPFNVELPARILHNTLSLPLASTVLSMNVHNKQVDTLYRHWTGSGNPVWNLRHQLMKIHSIVGSRWSIRRGWGSVSNIKLGGALAITTCR